MDLVTWPAPAKLNRFLHITGRRQDGYHLLQTVFQFIDFCDYIQLQVSHDGIISRTHELAGVAAEDDLVVRAARRLQNHCQCPLGVQIRVDKRIPMGGGLGGGSSDAATVLVALNRLWDLGLSDGALAGLGLELGADVPIFVYGQAAWAEGVGEQLTAVDLDKPWFLVLIPPIQVATAEIFCDPQLTRNSHPIKIPDFVAGGTRNDCEAVVCARYPELARGLQWLRRQEKSAQITGTGGCMFAPFVERQQALQALRSFEQTSFSGWQAIVAEGLNQSPLRRVLRS